MATKKIVITDKPVEAPEEAVDTAVSPVSDVVSDEEPTTATHDESSTDAPPEPIAEDEPATQEASPTDVSESEETPATDSEPEPDSQEPNENPEPKAQGQQQTKPRTSFLHRLGAQKLPIKLKRLKKKQRVIVFGLVIIVVLAGVYVHVKPTSNPLPASVKQKASFSVYYPKGNSSGYTYLPGSASYAAGKLTYSVGPKNLPTGGGSRFIRVSEQALSGKGPDLSSLPNFSVFKAPAGEAAVGPNGDVLNGILITKKTLIILNGLGGVSRQDMIQTINSIRS